MGVSGLQPRMPLLHGNPHLIQLLWSATVWLCQLAITPILRHVQTHRVVFATESPADPDGFDLHVKEGRFGGHNEGRGLVAHTLCAYIGEYESLEDDDSLITYFYENISPDTAGDASWQLMRWGNDQSEFKEHWNKVQYLTKHRQLT